MHTLPLALSSFVGRREELDELLRLLASARLLTLTGPGGVGKTRLAWELAARSAERFQDGVCWVELAALADGEFVAETLLAALGAGATPGRPAADSVREFLGRRKLLLLLDNCEHLAGPCARLVEALLRACPGVVVLATSREPLNVPGERVWLAPPLAVAANADGSLPEAVRLLLERAEESGCPIGRSPAELAVAGDICRRLDGIPLALELAAAKLRLLAPAELLARLHERFDLLTDGRRTALERHRTLRAVVDWSWDLLEPAERALLRRISVFLGGWTLDAADQVCSGAGIETPEVLPLLARLVEKSLVIVEDRDAGRRYQALETLRQYAVERLVESGEGEWARCRHVAWLRGLAEESVRNWIGPHTAAWLRRMELELDNAWVALAWAQAHPPARDDGLHLGVSLLWVFYLGGHLAEGSAALSALLAAAHADAARPSDPAAIAGVTSSLGILAVLSGRLEDGERLLREALELGEKLEVDVMRPVSYVFLGMAARLQGQLDRALELAAEATSGEAGNYAHVAALTAHGLRMEVALLRGDVAAAQEALEQGLALARARNDSYFLYSALTQVANLAIMGGDFERARSTLQETLEAALAMGDRANTIYDIEAAAALAAAEGRPRRALRLAGAAEAARERSGMAADRQHSGPLDSLLPDLRAGLPADVAGQAWQEGRALTFAQTVSYALDWDAPEDLVRPAARPILTPREWEVAQLVAEGLSNRQIGERLVISEGTAALHVQHILGKLGFNSRARIASWVTSAPDGEAVSRI